MEMQVIKNKTTVELQHDEETLRAQLFALRIQKSLGKLEAPHSITNIRKDIARIKTELSLRILNGEQIKPLHINKMVLPEDKKTDKKETKKIKSTAKDTKKVINKATDVVTIPEITKTVDKTNAKIAKNKEEVVKKELAVIKKPTAKVKTATKKPTVKTTSDPTVEKTTEPKEKKA